MRVRWIVGLLALLLLAYYGLPFGVDRNIRAAINEDVQRHTGYEVLTAPDIKLTRMLPGAAVVLATYEAIIDGEHVLVIDNTEVERQGLGWFARGGSSTWFPVAEPLPLFYAGGGGSGGPADPIAYAQASGLVNDPAVHEVAVTLNDGTREVTLVENGAFLYVKAGTLLPITAEALDVQGNVLHQQDLP